MLQKWFDKLNQKSSNYKMFTLEVNDNKVICNLCNITCVAKRNNMNEHRKS